MRKICTLMLTLVLSLSMCLPAFAQQEGTAEYSVEQQKAIDQVTQEYNKLYELNKMDADKALEELVKNVPSLKVVSNNKSYGYIVGDEMVVSEVQLYSSPADISFSDSIVYDSDWGTYVYFGGWNWRQTPNETNLQPWDMVGVYTQDSSQIRPREIIVRGYDKNGSRSVYYNTQTGSSDPIQKGIDSQSGVAFWHDESEVVNGQITAPLYYSSTSETAKIMIQYAHSWTYTSTTGIGGSIGVGSGGFNVSWSTGVYSWPGVISSSGARLADL